MNIFGEVLMVFLGCCIGVLCFAITIAFGFVAAAILKSVLLRGL